jgi:hypothetical protein
VGGTKAGPAVLWLYPFGGAPIGHKACPQIGPGKGAKKDRMPGKLYWNVAKAAPFKGWRNNSCLARHGRYPRDNHNAMQHK